MDATAANEVVRTAMLYVGGLVGSVAEDEELLSSIFGQFGIVLLVGIRVRSDDTNWALVTMLRTSEAEEATRKGKELLVKELEADGCEYNDEWLRVEYFDVRTALGELQYIDYVSRYHR